MTGEKFGHRIFWCMDGARCRRLKDIVTLVNLPQDCPRIDMARII